MNNRIKTLVAAVSTAVLMGAGSVHAGEVQSEIEALKKRLAELEAKLKEQPKLKLTGAGLRVKDPKSKSSFKLNGRLHLDVNSFDGAYNAKNNGDSASDVFARRARIGVSGNLDQDWSYQFVMAFAGGNRGGSNREDGRIQNAILSYNGFKRNGGPQIQLGKIKEDVTLEAVTSSNHLTTMSRSAIVNSVSPFFNWGVRVNQRFKNSGLRYAAGLYQAADGSSNGRDSKDGNNLLAFTGRVNWAPFAETGKVLHLGAWGSYRDFGGNGLRNRARGEIRNTNVRLLDSNAGGSSIAVDKITEYGLEFAGVTGPLSLQAEYIERGADTVLSSDPEPTLDGYYVTASYFLTGESRHYDAAKGVFKQPKGVRNAWELYARYSNADASFNNPSLAAGSQGTELDVLTLGVSYFASPQLRFMLNYQDAEVSGSSAATNALVGDQVDGKGLTFRTQYTF
ncbi:porin [Pseudoteredinibacter isoporae]|uniref:porin n=1 Tax=Pseudoteredinibacter isoporae TaxID=570281 RepID=UPI003105F369